MESQLKLEINTKRLPREPVFRGPPDKKGKPSKDVLLVCPPVGEDYWLYRVKLTERQAVLGFPKFLTIGIGFAKEEDWNTNLPYLAPTEVIFNHIKCNKGDDEIPDRTVKAAIMMIQNQAVADRGGVIGSIGKEL